MASEVKRYSIRKGIREEDAAGMYMYYADYATLERQLIDLRAALEGKIRKEWAFNHGCKLIALYGDDGEMQCGECFTDFKRLPLDDLERHVFAARLQALQSAMPGAVPQPRIKGSGPFDPRIAPLPSAPKEA